jgi:redox-sensitive bicupin YhaK (pirin superfamily)
MKKLSFVQRNGERHWVGDGFPVQTVFSYSDIAREVSPFLLLDYAAPTEFSPTEEKRGVGEHPHRGFETVTIVYEGEVEHRDSSGGGGKIGPGDVQWMTAASGLVHEEFHGRDFAHRGGTFEVVQLWVNLPKKHKMSAPGYQALLNTSIPRVELPKGAGSVRVIAGEYENQRGPARTFTPMNVWDLRLKAGHRYEFSIPDGWTTALFVLNGQIRLSEGESAHASELAVMDRKGERVSFEAIQDTKLLFLAGEPIEEPIVGYGPFVMNTQTEIRQAVLDYSSGKMGHLPA